MSTNEFSILVNKKPQDGTTQNNPFARGTAGSNSFRIPVLVTLKDGTLVAAADVRWNTTYDGGGLDTMVSTSNDNGKNWHYTFANYLGDNGDCYNGSASTCFIDPAIATDGTVLYMLCDLYPYGIALNGRGNTHPSTALGFNDDGKLLLRETNSTTYDYYLDGTMIKHKDGTVVLDYTVDAFFNLVSKDQTFHSNLFYANSPYKVVPTGYLYFTQSVDGGKTWSEPFLIPNIKTNKEQVCLIGPGRGLVTSKGALVFPCYSFNGSAQSQRTSFLYSYDKGLTWMRSADATQDIWSSESAIVELSDGTLRIFFRNGTKTLHYIDYHMDSHCFEVPVDTGIATNSNCQISAFTYSKCVDGKEVIFVSCPTGYNSKGSNDSSASARLNGKIFVGFVNHDKTMDWQFNKSIDVTSDNTQFMYSCMTELDNGNVAILYENKESAWGVGENCFYTMDFKVFEVNL